MKVKPRLQVIGLPGSGKTTAVARVASKHRDIKLIDIRDFLAAGHFKKEVQFKKAIIEDKSKKLIAESACGAKVNLYTIRLDVPIQQVYHQLRLRGDHVDEDYLSILHSQMVPADCTINSSEDLSLLLEYIFRKTER